MTALHVVVEADGGSRGNPGPAGYGAVVFDGSSGRVLAERKESIGQDTNNVAEYRGLIAGLRAAAELGASSVHVRMDSKLVVEQMSGRWQVKNDVLRRLVREAADLRARFAEVTFEWIPRARNSHADRLANEAMDAVRATVPAARASTANDPPPMWAPPDTQTPTRLLLVRHGATEHSQQRRFSGRNELPLDDVGRRQGDELAARVATFAAVREVAAVYSSPLLRARLTADLVGAAVGLDVTVADGLAEADFGAWEGLTTADVARDWPAEFAAWTNSPDVAPPGGESFRSVERRVRRVRDQAIAAHPGGTVVLVSHVTPIKTLLRLALDAPWQAMYRIHLDTGSICVVDHYPDGQSSVRLLNDSGHPPA